VIFPAAFRDGAGTKSWYGTPRIPGACADVTSSGPGNLTSFTTLGAARCTGGPQPPAL
jgi:hypothetical protein